jgi:hypothetical protein
MRNGPKVLYGLCEELLFVYARNSQIGNVRRRDGKAVGPTLPEYIVRSASYRGWKPTQSIKIIDFKESFYTPPHRRNYILLYLFECLRLYFRTTLTTESICGAWAYGKWSCQYLENPHSYRYKKLFELFTSQSHFGTFMITHPVLVRQMHKMASDVLPARWHNSWDTMKEKDSGTPEPPEYGLQECGKGIL